MAKHPDTELSFFVEPLENRILLSGNVLAAFVGDTLVVHGDELDNDIELALVDSNVSLIGNDTTINGTNDDFVVSQADSEIQIRFRATLRGGDDRLVIRDGKVIQDSIVVFAGDGEDSLGFEGLDGALRLIVHAGNGDDSIAVRDTNIENAVLVTGHGNDTVSIRDSSFDSLKTSTGSGDDNVTLDSIAADRVKTVFGRGNDNLVADAIAIDRRLVAIAGTGDDLVQIKSGAIREKSLIGMGAGNDVAIIDEAVEFSGRSIIPGGGGRSDQVSLPLNENTRIAIVTGLKAIPYPNRYWITV